MEKPGKASSGLGRERTDLYCHRSCFKDNKGKIGRTGVTVPGFFYKVVYAPGARQMIAFVLPNTQEKRQLRDYAVTVDSVERLTNIDFSHNYPIHLKIALKRRSIMTVGDKVNPAIGR